MRDRPRFFQFGGAGGRTPGCQLTGRVRREPDGGEYDDAELRDSTTRIETAASVGSCGLCRQIPGRSDMPWAYRADENPTQRSANPYKEGRRRNDRDIPPGMHVGEVRIARDDKLCIGRLCEGEELVVFGIDAVG